MVNSQITKNFNCNYINKLPGNGILPIILSSPFTSCSLINLDFLLPQTAQVHETIILLIFVLQLLGF